MHKTIINQTLSLLGVATAMVATTTLSLPARADFRPYRFVSGQESIRLDADAFESLEDIGLTLSEVENLVPPASGFDFGWPVVPPATTASGRGTDFEFLFDEDTDTFAPVSGTVEFNGSFFLEVDPTKFNLTSPLEIGELSVFFDENFEFFATDTATTNLPVMSVNTFEAPTIDLENRTWFLEPIELILTSEFSDFLIDAAITPETAEQVASTIPGLKIGEARGDRGFVALETAPVPEPSNLLALLMTVATVFLVKKKW